MTASSTQKTPQQIAEQFAAAAPIGTACLYYPTKPFQRDQAKQAKICSEPWVLGHGQVVVKIDCIAGGVAIEHIAFASEVSQRKPSDIVLDSNGRVKYNPDLHLKQNTPWKITDQKYLIENYGKESPEALSLKLQRTLGTIYARACILRKQGLLPAQAPKPPRNKRTRYAS
jgi:hypothetical protein